MDCFNHRVLQEATGNLVGKPLHRLGDIESRVDKIHLFAPPSLSTASSLPDAPVQPSDKPLARSAAKWQQQER
jgi:hypothetical protein